MRIFIPLFLFLVISFTSIAQQTRTVSGSVVDSTKDPLTDVSVNLKSSTENLTTKTNAAGKYHFTNVSSSEFVISITSVGFQNYSQAYTVGNKDGKAFIIDPVKLKEKTNELAEVVITANPITIKEDTIEYRANAYKVRDGAPVEDVIKKLPGVTVDKDGVVTAQGKEVKRVRVNGKDYFGGDVQTATQNLPADIIDNIQIIDDYGDRANQTGIKEGEPEKILNINIQRGKNKGNFGNGTVGGGTAGRYLARVAANNFKEDRQISLLGSLNNTNANTFNFNGGGRGGGARGANFGSAERGGSGGDGTTYSQSLGLNYRDTWGKKITSYGSYSFSGRKNNTTGTTVREDQSPDFPRTTKSASNSNSKTENHRITWNLEYKMDSANYLKVTPFFSYSSSSGSSNGFSDIVAKDVKKDITSYSFNKSTNRNSSTSPAGGSDLLYIHRFKQKGRSFSISGSMNNSIRDQDSYPWNSYHDSASNNPFATDSIRNQFINTNTANTTTNIRVSYAQPIGKFTALEASYTWNNSTTKSLRDVNDIDGLSGLNVKNIKLSNDYKYRFITNRYGLTLHHFKTKYNFLIGIVAQPSTLTGMDNGRAITTQNTSFNIMPNARIAYNFSRSHSLTANYNGSSREPSFNQLQPVSDSSNIKNIVTGNQDLKAEFTNRFSLQYNKVGILKGTSFFSNISFDETQNKIVSSRVTKGTSRSTTYLNTNGFYGFNGNVSMTQPFFKKKFTATISASGSYDNNISFSENKKNTGNNWTIRPGARLRIDFPDIIDVNINGNYNYNKNITRYDTFNRVNEAKTLTFGIDGKNYFLKDWTLGYELNKTINSGFLSTVSNPTILTLYVERRFLKNNKGTLRLQGFDLFNENTGISRDVNGDVITDRQSNRLGRYFLLTFNLRLQKFTGSKQFQRMPGEKNGNRDGNRGPRNGGGFGNGGGNRNGGGRNN